MKDDFWQRTLWVLLVVLGGLAGGALLAYLGRLMAAWAFESYGGGMP